MGELEDRLKRLAEHRATQIPAFSMAPADELAVRRRVARRNWVVVGIAACLALALVIGGLVLVSRKSEPPTVEAPAGTAPSTAVNTEGVGDNSVKLGYIWSGTGTGAANSDSEKACQA